jgi:hypothetical protein
MRFNAETQRHAEIGAENTFPEMGGRLRLGIERKADA